MTCGENGPFIMRNLFRERRGECSAVGTLVVWWDGVEVGGECIESVHQLALARQPLAALEQRLVPIARLRERLARADRSRGVRIGLFAEGGEGGVEAAAALLESLRELVHRALGHRPRGGAGRQFFSVPHGGEFLPHKVLPTFSSFYLGESAISLPQKNTTRLSPNR